MAILPELSVRPDGWITNPRAAPLPEGWITTPHSVGTSGRGIIASALEDVPAESPAFTGPGALRYAIDLTSKLSQGMNLNSEEIVAAKRLGVMVPTRIPAIPNHPIPQIPGLR